MLTIIIIHVMNTGNTHYEYLWKYFKSGSLMLYCFFISIYRTDFSIDLSNASSVERKYRSSLLNTGSFSTNLTINKSIEKGVRHD